MEEQKTTEQHKRTELWKSAAFRWLIFAQLLGLFFLAYIKIGGLLITQTNQTDRDLLSGDQGRFIAMAVETSDDLKPDFRKGFTGPLHNFFPHRTDGVLEPLWPWMAAWMVEGKHQVSEPGTISNDDRKLFELGRYSLVWMTCGFVLMLGVASARIFSLPAALNLMLLGGLGALLPRAVFFQSEPLYYIFFFLTWVACVSALGHNSLWVYGLIGVLSGLAYMADTSVHLLLGIFFFVSSMRCVWEFISARRRGYRIGGGNLWHWRNHFVGLVMLMAAHFMTIGPRMTEAYEKFGNMFHSYPSYWMWMDTPKQSQDWMREHSSREQLSALRKGLDFSVVEGLRQSADDVHQRLEADRPTLINYWRSHSSDEIWLRLRDGTVNLAIQFLWPSQTLRTDGFTPQGHCQGLLEWRGLYLGWLLFTLFSLLILMNSAAPQAEHIGHIVFRHSTVMVICFVLFSVVAYTAVNGWYSAIAPGNADRFMLVLYLPLVFSFIWGSETIIRRLRRRHSSPWIMRGYLLSQWLLSAAISWRIVEILKFPYFQNA